MLIVDARLGGGGGSVDVLEGEAGNRIKRNLTGSTEQHNLEQNLSSKWTLNGLNRKENVLSFMSQRNPSTHCHSN